MGAVKSHQCGVVRSFEQELKYVNVLQHLPAKIAEIQAATEQNECLRTVK
jgi:hypothetical protein